jgi:hypothetical protein
MNFIMAPPPPKYACLTEFKKYGGTTNPQI